MAIELALHVNKSDYENLIGQLDGKLNEMTTLLSDYQGLKSRVDTFIQERDSNFQNMQANVDNNIDAVRRAMGFTMTAKDNLQKTVDQMDDMASNVGNLMKTAAETATNAIKTAIRIDGLGL